MNALEIIAAIQETHTEKSDILAALEDGEALSHIGAIDQDEVEEAHFIVSNWKS